MNVVAMLSRLDRLEDEEKELLPDRLFGGYRPRTASKLGQRHPELRQPVLAALTENA